MKINGKLRCKIEMKGVETEGYAYVTPYNSLMGRKLRTRLSLLLPMDESRATPPSEENWKKMIEHFNRRNNAVPKEFEIGEAVYAQIWKAPQVNYEVDLSGRITKKHANQLRRRDAETSSSYEDKSLLILLETLELGDVWKRREDTTRTMDAAALG
ncbi:hypothetical protein OSTOST_01614 [Ostertagia ostertagi]